MLRINRNGKCFERLATPDLKGADLSERYHLQAMICRNPEAFFQELGEELLLLGQDVRPAEDVVDDRIDLLAIDRAGAVVIIELKRGSNKLQLLQSLAYAAMISEWESKDFSELRGRLTAAVPDAVEDEFRQFLNEDIEGLNPSQRIILVAEEFDYEVLVTAEWLSEQYGVDISCYRLALSTDGDSEYLACVRVFPPTKAAEQAIRRKRKTTRPSKWPSWDAALQDMSNPALADFFKAELAAKRDNYLRKRVLRYHLDGRRRWTVWGRQDQAYVWQNGRFTADEAFWSERLGAEAEVKPVKDEKYLRFMLSTEKQFACFLRAVSAEVAAKGFEPNGEEPNEEQ